MFGVLGGQQKCIEIHRKMAMPPFKLRATPFQCDMCYLSESSVKLETLANMWNLESGESSVSFSRNRDFCLISLLLTSEISEGGPWQKPSPLWGCHPFRTSGGFVFGRLVSSLISTKASSEGRGWILTIISISLAGTKRRSVSSFSQSKVMT